MEKYKFLPDSWERCESIHWAPPSLAAAEGKTRKRRVWVILKPPDENQIIFINYLFYWDIYTKLYPDFLKIVEVVADSHRDLTRGVALVWLIISINAQHLHCRPPPLLHRSHIKESELMTKQKSKVLSAAAHTNKINNTFQLKIMYIFQVYFNFSCTEAGKRYLNCMLTRWGCDPSDCQ